MMSKYFAISSTTTLPGIGVALSSKDFFRVRADASMVFESESDGRFSRPFISRRQHEVRKNLPRPSKDAFPYRSQHSHNIQVRAHTVSRLKMRATNHITRRCSALPCVVESSRPKITAHDQTSATPLFIITTSQNLRDLIIDEQVISS